MKLLLTDYELKLTVVFED